MEETNKLEEVRILVRSLRKQYLLFWLTALFFVIAFECNLLKDWLFEFNSVSEYVFQTLGILFTLFLIPLALKMFSVILSKRIPSLSFKEALSEHMRWSIVRLSCFVLVVILNIVVYYSTSSNIGLLCASIGLLASVFCWPSSNRIKSELGL